MIRAEDVSGRLVVSDLAIRPACCPFGWATLLVALALLLPNGSPAIGAPASPLLPIPIAASWASPAEASSSLSGKMIAQADDLGSPPSPGAIVATPPPAPVAEIPPSPLPGYAWDPGHWYWDGTQYVWEPGKYVAQPTNGATFTPGYWQEISGGWAWTEGRWSWGTQGEGE